MWARFDSKKARGMKGVTRGLRRGATVEDMMIKRILGYSLAALGAATLAAGPAQADYREAAYLTTLFSDASHTEVVGHIVPECGFRYVQYHLEGTYTYYTEDEFVGYCTENGWEQL
jgi:hypothetical protein